MAAHLDPKVVMYQAESLPYGGEWVGPKGIEAFMAAMSEAWTSLVFLEQRFAVQESTVAVYNRGVLTVRATGREFETSIIQWVTVVNGLITEFRPFYLDTVAVREALGYERAAAS